MQRLLLIVAAASALVASAASGQRTGLIQVGEPFPEITLPSLDGEAWSIAEMRGRKVMLHVFASW